MNASQDAAQSVFFWKTVVCWHRQRFVLCYPFGLYIRFIRCFCFNFCFSRFLFLRLAARSPPPPLVFSCVVFCFSFRSSISSHLRPYLSLSLISPYLCFARLVDHHLAISIVDNPFVSALVGMSLPKITLWTRR